MKSNRSKLWLLGLLLSLAVTGCGQKGPLFLPEDNEQEEEQESAVEPSAYIV